MDLLAEAEKALSPTHECGLEVPNGAAGHYLLGLIYRYTDRTKSAVHHFKQALPMDPLFWAAYEELCTLGAAEEAAAVFGEAAVLSLQKQQQQQHVLTSQNSVTCIEEHNPKQLKNLQSSSVKDASGSCHRTATASAAVNPPSNYAASLSFYNTPSQLASQLSGLAPPLCRNVQQNLAPASSESCPRSTVNTTLQAPRRKFVDEGKLRKISGRLFTDSGLRLSTRLNAETSGNGNGTTTLIGNGTSHSTRHLGNSRLSNVELLSVTIRKE